MSTVMQTHLETQFKETRTLTLKLSPPPPPSEKTQKNCWNFLETTPSPKFTPYIHPSTNKKSQSFLISLELCTENLGSESGSDMSDDIFDILSMSSTHVFHDQPAPKPTTRGLNLRKKVVDTRSIPPPLTTIRGINPIKVRSKREGGRLVIDAVEERAVCNYFRSDRSHGRLRLSFWDNSVTTTDEDEFEDQEIDEVEEDVATAASTPEEDIIGNKKFQRSSRCMEGNNNKKGLCNWEPLWVAT
ncbi:protein FANTASTIC FOUR 3-like [Impatiens glandulifera]|uniref:protein FANTASTIC FOUR 3-like n=1 Tax=Impatiens glandulifera TaxID=253017 RepID=UPI001FB051EC|nr:protein FANTASTIC FOUR 3-like [Impatiens glandulifera]XP_047336856.1 protein FANTASTIC FOUR 3-like [Impatiens glandulifera]